jgi:hypothetical protein
MDDQNPMNPGEGEEVVPAAAPEMPEEHTDAPAEEGQPAE